MAQDIVTVLKVETGNSEKTIKALKEEIKNLKTTLESAEIGSEEFTQASQQLAAAQAELKTAMDSTKQTAEAADGSYNALVATMAELKKEWKATADEVERSEIGAKIEEINSQLKELDESIGNSQRNVGNYKQDFVDAMTEMKQKGASFGDELNEINKKTEVTRNTLDGVGQVASGVASGFAAVQGVSALLGMENQNLEKALVKVQSAMAIAQGIGGMKGMVEGAGKLVAAYRAAKMGSAALATQTTATSAAMTASAGATNVATVALQGFKAALISTGIGAIVVALGTLIGYLLTLGDTADDVTNDIERLRKEFQDLYIPLNNDVSEQEYILRLLRAQGATEEEIFEARRNYANQNWAKAMTITGQARSELAEANRLYGNDEEYADVIKAYEDFYNEALAIEQRYKDEITKVGQDENVWKAEQKLKAEQDAAEAAAQAERERIQAEKERVAAEKAQREADLDAIRQYGEEARLALLGEEERELEMLRIKYEEKKALFVQYKQDTKVLDEAYAQERQEITDKYDEQERQKAIEKANFLKSLEVSMMGDQDREVEELEMMFEQYKSQFQLNAEELFILEEWKQAELAKIRDKYREEEQVKEWIFLQNMKEDTKALITNTTQAASAAMSGASQILSALAANQDQTNKEGFEKAKKMQIASATMNMLAGITAALSGLFTTKTGPWDLVLAGIQAATIATTGGIQIANIKKQQYDGSGGSGVGSVPSFNVNDMMPIQYTRELMTDTETTNLNRDQKVYVLESDITETQENVAVKESNSSF